MDTKRLHYFCTIIEQGQISRAARALNITQPPLSQRLLELEEELGTRLIIREGHHWQVTEAGRLVYQRARHLLNQINEIPSEVKNVVDGFSGTLQVGSSSTCVSSFLKVLPALHQRYPALKFRILTADSNELEAHVQARDLDFAIILLPVHGSGYAVQVLPADTFSVVMAPELEREELPASLQIEDLAGIPLVCSRRWSGGGSYDRLLRAFQEKRITPEIVLDTPDTRTGLGALFRGLKAAAIFPANEVPPECFDRFRVHSLDLADMAIHPAIIRLKDRFLSLATQVVIEAIAQC